MQLSVIDLYEVSWKISLWMEALLLNQKENVQAMDMFSESEEALLVMTERELSFEVLMKFGMIESILKSILWIYSFPRQLVTSNAV